MFYAFIFNEGGAFPPPYGRPWRSLNQTTARVNSPSMREVGNVTPACLPAGIGPTWRGGAATVARCVGMTKVRSFDGTMLRKQQPNWSFIIIIDHLFVIVRVSRDAHDERWNWHCVNTWEFPRNPFTKFLFLIGKRLKLRYSFAILL